MSQRPTPSEVTAYLERRQELTQQVKERLIEALMLEMTPDELDLDAPLFGAGLGLDSVDALGIAASIEQSFEVQVQDTDINLFRSTNAIVDFVLAKLAASGTEESGAPLTSHLPHDVEDFLDVPARFEELDDDEDYAKARKAAAVIDYSAAEKLRIRGPQAFELLNTVVSGNLEELAAGDMLQTLFLRDDGVIHAIVWILRDGDAFWVIGQHDAPRELGGWLRTAIAELDVSVDDCSSSHGLVSFVGPSAQEAIVDLFGQDLLRLSYCESEACEWAGRSYLVCRYGDSGEFDYRLLYERDDDFDVVANACEELSLPTADASVARTLALEMKSIRNDFLLAEGCRPEQVDLRWMLDMHKESFRGRDALLTPIDPDARQAHLLVGEGEDPPAPGTRVLLADREVGLVHTSIFSARGDASVALCYLDPAVAWSGVSFILQSDDAGEREFKSCSAPLFVTRTVTDSLNM